MLTKYPKWKFGSFIAILAIDGNVLEKLYDTSAVNCVLLIGCIFVLAP
jgi:hypothetical protein